MDLNFVTIIHPCFSPNCGHYQSQLDPGADGEDKEIRAFGWRVWNLQDCHHS